MGKNIPYENIPDGRAVIADSLVPDTEEFQLRCAGSNDETVADSLVADTQKSLPTRLSPHEQTIPDSHVSDSLPNDSTKSMFSSSSHAIPDSFVPESSGTRSAFDSLELETKTIADSQEHLVKAGQAFGTMREKNHTVKTKKKRKKLPHLAIEQIHYSSDSSFDEGLTHTFIETFSVDQNDKVYLNQMKSNCETSKWSAMNPKSVDPRLLKLLSKNTDSNCTRPQDVSHKIVTTSTSQVLKDKENKQPGNNNTKGNSRKNIFDIFYFTSEEEDEVENSITVLQSENESGSLTNTSKSVDNTVIDELSQRLTNILSKPDNKSKEIQK